MTDSSLNYIQKVSVEEIPWHRLTTAYKRAADFPVYFAELQAMEDLENIKKAINKIAINIEHQSTLWHATPFTLIFLLRILADSLEKRKSNEIADYIAKSLLELFAVIAEGICEGKELEHPEHLPEFADMLREEYLWSEEYDEEEDAMRYEEDEVFPEILFFSFYYYSYQVLKLCRPLLNPLNDEREKALYSWL